MTVSTSTGASMGSSPNITLNNSTSNGPLNASNSNDPHANATASAPSGSSSSAPPEPQTSHPGSPPPSQTTTSNDQGTSQPNDGSHPGQENPKKSPEEKKQDDGLSSDHAKSYQRPTNYYAAATASANSRGVSMHQLEVHEPYKGAYPDYWGKHTSGKYGSKKGWSYPTKRSNRMNFRRQLPKAGNEVVIQ